MAAGSSTAKLLRELRERRGTSLRAAADDLGVAPSHLSRLERGEKAPSPELANKVAKYYEVDADLIALEQGRVPEDIVGILQRNPHLLGWLRAEYGREPEA